MSSRVFVGGAVVIVVALVGATAIVSGLRPSSPRTQTAQARSEQPSGLELGRPGELVTVRGLVLLDCNYSTADGCTLATRDGSLAFLETGYDGFRRMPRRGSVVDVRGYTRFSPRFRDDLALLSLETDADEAGPTWVRKVGKAERLDVRGLVGEIDKTYEQIRGGGSPRFRPTGKESVELLAPVWTLTGKPQISHGERAASFIAPSSLKDELVELKWDGEAGDPTFVTFSLVLHWTRRASGYELVEVEASR
jgi:hypothetical protein